MCVWVGGGGECVCGGGGEWGGYVCVRVCVYMCVRVYVCIICVCV